MALDGLGEKFLSLFKPKEDPKFKGPGRKLGSAEVPAGSGHPAQRHAPNSASRGAQAARPTNPDVPAPNGAVPPLQPPPQPLGTGGRPALVVSRSHRTEDVVLDAAVMVTNTPTGREANLVANSKLQPGTPSSPPTSCGMPSPGQPSSPYSPTAPPPSAPLAGGGGVGGATLNGAPLAVEVPRYSPGGGSQGVTAGAQRESRSSANHRTSRSSNPNSMVSTISTPTAAEKRIGGGFRCSAPPTDGAMADYGVAPASSEAYELQRCLAHVLSYIPPTPPRSPPPPSPPRPHAPAPPSNATSSSLTASGSDDPSTGGPSSTSTSSAAASRGAQQQPSGVPDFSVLPGPAPPSAIVSGASTCLLAAPPAATPPAGPRECCDAMLRVLRNVLTKPGEPKYRQIRLSNPKVQETIVGVPGAVEFLEAAGFRMEFAPDDGSANANEAYLVLPEAVAPTALAEAFRVLSAAMAAHGFSGQDPDPQVAAVPGAAGTAAAAAGNAAAAEPPPRVSPPSRAGLEAARAAAATMGVPAVERCTQVVLPAAPDVEVPDWFFERTGAEVRAQWQAMLRQRQEGEQFMTRTMREVRRQQQAAAAAAEEAAAGPKPPAGVATVRVRFPEGVCLQGHFGASEPVTRVFEWVASSLRSPTLTFELIQPDRRPLPTTTAPTASASGAGSRAQRPAGGPPMPLTVRGADMLPSVLLNLRPTGQEAAALTAANVPLLSDAMLRTTRPQ